MTNRERHTRRDEVARANGYKPVPSPADVEYAGRSLPDAIDKQVADAALTLRGLPTPKDRRLRAITRKDATPAVATSR